MQYILPDKPKGTLIPLSVGAQILPVKERRIRAMCAEGQFRSAVQPGGSRGQWFILREEVINKIKPKSE